MKGILATICLSLMASQSHAYWSGFAHVTPETEEDYGVEVSLTPMDGQTDKLLIRVEAVDYDHKLAWLVVTSGELSQGGRRLRTHLWESSPPEKDILLKTRLMPTGVGGARPQNKDPKFYEVELDSGLMKHAYIYIDFPSVVRDGGYYYSVDLGAYLGHHRAGAAESSGRDSAKARRAIEPEDEQ